MPDSSRQPTSVCTQSHWRLRASSCTLTMSGSLRQLFSGAADSRKWRLRLPRSHSCSASLRTGSHGFLAPSFAQLAGSPEATPVVRLLAVVILIDGVTAVRTAALQRRFQQDKLTQANMAGFVVQAPLAVALQCGCRAVQRRDRAGRGCARDRGAGVRLREGSGLDRLRPGDSRKTVQIRSTTCCEPRCRGDSRQRRLRHRRSADGRLQHSVSTYWPSIFRHGHWA